MLKRVLVTGAGGSPATNFVRSLKKAPEEIYLVGTDADKYHLSRAETHQRYLVPLANDPQFLHILNAIIEAEDIGFVHAQNDTEVNYLSENRADIKTRTFLPSLETVRVCQDKFESFRRWQDAGLKVPETVIITDDETLQAAFKQFGGEMWIRATSGAGGRGALPVRDLKSARNWLDLQQGWGTFTAAELLEPSTVTWMSLWHEGELVVAQGRKRLYWELAKVSPSGVTGATGGAVTFRDSALDVLAQKVVLAIDEKPHGLFGVDLTYDKQGSPNPTEINIGRFFTTHQFFTELGLNMPYIFTQLAFGETPELPENRLNPVPDDMIWIRGIDFEPVLTSVAEIERPVLALEAMRQVLAP